MFSLDIVERLLLWISCCQCYWNLCVWKTASYFIRTINVVITGRWKFLRQFRNGRKSKGWRDPSSAKGDGHSRSPGREPPRREWRQRGQIEAGRDQVYNLTVACIMTGRRHWKQSRINKLTRSRCLWFFRGPETRLLTYGLLIVGLDPVLWFRDVN